MLPNQPATYYVNARKTAKSKVKSTKQRVQTAEATSMAQLEFQDEVDLSGPWTFYPKQKSSTITMIMILCHVLRMKYEVMKFHNTMSGSHTVTLPENQRSTLSKHK